ncbi:MAG: DUF554 domain-containing protein [Defluviitaleaceae bacterium]|nr:DUF554 domain-containing protein [Defluviitaleaceae bacterium]
MTGAIINALAILAGGGIGLLLKSRINKKITDGILKAMGLCVCIIGISGALGGDITLMITSLALGVLSGEVMRLDDRLNSFGMFLQKKFGKNDENSTFAQGFVSATLLYCVGAMAIVGSLDSGLRGDQSIIIAKSLIDAATSIALAASLGIGVLFSAAIVFIYQGSIEIFASALQNVFTYELITQITAVGGVMILGIGVNLTLGEQKIKVANLLPGFLFAIGYYYVGAAK